jgi:hypothetical protein
VRPCRRCLMAAHARAPSRVLQGQAGTRAALAPVRGRARRLRTEEAAIARELGQGRKLARDRGVFLLRLDRLGRRAPWRRLSRRPRRRRASHQPRAHGLKWCARGHGARSARGRPSASAAPASGLSLKGAAPACRLGVGGPRARSARGRRARHAECRSASAEGWLSRHSACRVPRLFAPGVWKVAR